MNSYLKTEVGSGHLSAIEREWGIAAQGVGILKLREIIS